MITYVPCLHYNYKVTKLMRLFHMYVRRSSIILPMFNVKKLVRILLRVLNLNAKS